MSLNLPLGSLQIFSGHKQVSNLSKKFHLVIKNIFLLLISERKWETISKNLRKALPLSILRLSIQCYFLKKMNDFFFEELGNFKQKEITLSILTFWKRGMVDREQPQSPGVVHNDNLGCPHISCWQTFCNIYQDLSCKYYYYYQQ